MIDFNQMMASMIKELEQTTWRARRTEIYQRCRSRPKDRDEVKTRNRLRASVRVTARLGGAWQPVVWNSIPERHRHRGLPRVCRSVELLYDLEIDPYLCIVTIGGEVYEVFNLSEIEDEIYKANRS